MLNPAGGIGQVITIRHASEIPFSRVPSVRTRVSAHKGNTSKVAGVQRCSFIRFTSQFRHWPESPDRKTTVAAKSG